MQRRESYNRLDKTGATQKKHVFPFLSLLLYETENSRASQQAAARRAISLLRRAGGTNRTILIFKTYPFSGPGRRVPVALPQVVEKQEKQLKCESVPFLYKCDKY